MNYKCECCNVSFRTPNEHKRHLVTSKHIKNTGAKTPAEYEVELINLKHEMEMMKKDHQIELLQLKNEMYEKFFNMKQEPKNETTTTPVVSSNPPSSVSPQETEGNTEGRAFLNIMNDINEEIMLCDHKAFKKDNKEEEEEKAIFSLESYMVDDSNYKLYDLYCNLTKSKGKDKALEVLMDYLYLFIQPEDYRIPENNKNTDRIYFIKTTNTWFTELESKRNIDELFGWLRTLFQSFTTNVFVPLREKHSTNDMIYVSVINNAWWLSRGISTDTIIKRLVKDKKIQP